MIAAEKIAYAGSLLLMASQLLCALALLQLRNERRSLLLLILTHALTLTAIGCVAYEALFFGF